MRSEQLLVHSLIVWARCSVLSLSITLQLTQCLSGREAKQRNIPSEKWYFSFARHDCHHRCFNSATIDSARLVVKGRSSCIVPLSWHAREGQEIDCDSFDGSLCPNQPLRNPSRRFCLTEEVFIIKIVCCNL